MAINPVSDIVMDVARAADPQAYQMAIHRLQSLDPTGSGMVADSDLRLTREYFPDLVAMNKSAPAVADPRKTALQKFEAVVLQSFVENMFTSDSSATFGKGIAGQYWKSILAEAMAGKMAENGGVGIAAMLAANQSGGALSDTASHAGAGKEIDGLSADIVHGVERRLIHQQLGNSDFGSV